MMRFVTAFLLHNRLLKTMRLCFFVDGEQALNLSILNHFEWHGNIGILLDWPHMIRRCARLMRAALPEREVRLEYLREIRRYLWFGAVDPAVRFIKAIPVKTLGQKESINEAISYLQRNRSRIPCYAARKQLGLRNSSNRVETENNRVISSRQKKRGMSWSEEGSLSLAALTVVERNGHRDHWLRKKEVPLRFAKAA